jgi:hypothetical protein
MTEPGVYRSDVEGHLFVLKLYPLSITCVVCMETCSQSQFKNLSEYRLGAAAFTSRHGYLDERIANSIVEIIPPRESK